MKHYRTYVSTRVRLKRAEVNAILAGLRLLQKYLVGQPQVDDLILGIATNDGEEKALGMKDIDTLCERINR